MKNSFVRAFVLVGLLFLFIPGGDVASAYSPAPLNTEMKSVPALVPFRVWVLPSNAQGGMRSGYYKYLHLQMSQPEAETLATPGMVPASAPIAPPMGQPAIPTM